MFRRISAQICLIYLAEVFFKHVSWHIALLKGFSLYYQIRYFSAIPVYPVRFTP